MLKANFFNLVITYNTEKAIKAAAVFIKATEKHVNMLKYYVNNTFCNNNSKENSNENIIKIIQSEIKTAM
jgi:hypothetical protein